MDNLLKDVWINLLYLKGGRFVEWIKRRPPPIPEEDCGYNPTEYPNDGKWPEYMRSHCQHLFTPPTLQNSYSVGGGESISDFGDLVSFPANTSHRGVADGSEERVCLFWFSFPQKHVFISLLFFFLFIMTYFFISGLPRL
jgi:hypothetical protein